MKLELDEADFLAAARILGCSRAVIRAVADVEAPRGAFEPDGKGGWRPTILFERHYFSRMTNRRFEYRRAPGVKPPNDIISHSIGGGYGLFSEQHKKLAFAADLARAAYGSHDVAMKSASWGMFQIMGLYHREAGHPTIQGFVNAMYRGADRHLHAFVALIRSRLLDVALREKDFVTFKNRYNGTGANPEYIPKMIAACEKWEKHYAQVDPSGAVPESCGPPGG